MCIRDSGNGIYQGDLLDADPPVATNDLNNKEITNLKNYPNPVSVDSRVNFVLAQKTDLSISLYGNDGKLIRKLFSGVKLSGEHSLDFEWNDLPAGIYYYNLNGRVVATGEKILKSSGFVKE